MAKELIISSNRHETKVAMFEDEQLVEIYFQRSDEYSLAGSIHKGRVTRVLPGMQSAFVNIGLERDAFLYVSDFFEESEEEFDKTPVTNRDRHKSRVPKMVDEDTGEPTNESNERFATAQTVAELAVVEDGQDAPDIDLDEEEAEEEVAEPAVRAERPVISAMPEVRPAPRSDEGGDFDDRRGRRRRRRRGRGGTGLPESKFAEGGPAAPPRFENRVEHKPPQARSGAGRPPRGPVDEDARWNRKPVTPVRNDFEEEDPPQAVLIAKVSDPNRLPPPRRGEDTSPIVLPGESLAKYRRGSGPAGKQSQEYGDAGEPAGSRYSQPRRNRHGRAGFLAPGGDEATGESAGQPAEGSSASLFPPDDSNPRFALKGSSGENTAESTEKKKPAAKRAAKAAKPAAKKAARKKATKKAASAADPEALEADAVLDLEAAPLLAETQAALFVDESDADAEASVHLGAEDDFNQP
ncbi:MAG: hypothetical protein MUF01_18265, partial [Bryobacterales bacterium]|nr:hypothetical protein [Bryobacterales bacterium]